MIYDIPTIFGLIAVIIFIGFFGALMFYRTKIPEILILISLGIFLGPVLSTFFGIELIPRKSQVGIDLVDIAKYFAALALMIILFDAGMGLNFDKLIGVIGIAFYLSISVFLLTMLFTALIGLLFLDIGLIQSLLLGAILGGTSSAVIIPLLRGLKIKEETKTLLTIESVLTDVLCVVAVISLIGMSKTKGSVTYGIALQNLASAFSISILIGFLFGIFWLVVLKSLHGKQYAYMITFAALFGLYGCVEYLKGSGAIASLIFGFVLSNSAEITRIFKMKTEFVVDAKIRQFHSEITFFIRTFFFVYLGLMFTFPEMFEYSSWLFIFVSILIFLVILVSRYCIVTTVVFIRPEHKKDKNILWTMLPRGLAAAVLSAMVVAEGVPETQQFINLTFLIILFTVCATTIGTYISHKQISKSNSETKSKPQLTKTEKQKKAK